MWKKARIKKAKITDEEVDILHEISVSGEMGKLILMKGYVNSKERTLLCIDIEDDGTHYIYPKAVLIDLEKDIVLGPDMEEMEVGEPDNE